MADDLVDAGQAAALLGVPRGRIYAWKNSGDITPAGLVPGTSRSGMVPMFKLDELRPLAQRYHDRAARSRAATADSTAL